MNNVQNPKQLNASTNLASDILKPMSDTMTKNRTANGEAILILVGSCFAALISTYI